MSHKDYGEKDMWISRRDLDEIVEKAYYAGVRRALLNPAASFEDVQPRLNEALSIEGRASQILSTGNMYLIARIVERISQENERFSEVLGKEISRMWKKFDDISEKVAK